ncbi:MAG: hypothetical protein IM600_18600 [Bacteroidetes bacterium]|nr:hypothetical protein [Bacteroidota bacterium]
MITREQYLEALDIVETYHQQLRQFSVVRSLKGWNDLQLGDRIVFDKSMSKDVLVGKEYEITNVGHDWKEQHYSNFGFVCENGREKYLRKHPSGYRVRLV